MESARALLARKLPLLNPLGLMATDPAVSSERIYVNKATKTWRNFTQEVVTTLNSHDLTPEVSLTDEDDPYVASELGLATRFHRYVCDPVAKALSVTTLPLRFGGIQASFRPCPTSGISHLVLSELRQAMPFGSNPAITIAVRLFNPKWPVHLESFSSRSVADHRDQLKPHISTFLILFLCKLSLPHNLVERMVSHMRSRRLNYGFLTNYEFTVFIWRKGNRSYLSTMISHRASSPSPRECFAGIAVSAARSRISNQSSNVDECLVSPLFYPSARVYQY